MNRVLGLHMLIATQIAGLSITLHDALWTPLLCILAAWRLSAFILKGATR